MITNDTGQVALKHYQPAQVIAQSNPSGNDYVFVPKANISLAFVRQEDIDSLLARKTCACGGQNRKSRFLYANEDDVRRWSNGGGR